jgi:hypothetical protein
MITPHLLFLSLKGEGNRKDGIVKAERRQKNYAG